MLSEQLLIYRKSRSALVATKLFSSTHDADNIAGCGLNPCGEIEHNSVRYIRQALR